MANEDMNRGSCDVNVEGKVAAVTWWLDDVMMDEHEASPLLDRC